MKLNIFRFEKKPPPLTWGDNIFRLTVAILVYFICLYLSVTLLPGAGAIGGDQYALFLPSIIVLAFFFQATDSVAGMGFGTALVPLLIAFDYEPLAIVPMLLIVQAFSGLLAGWLHKEVGNVIFTFKPLNHAAHALILIVITGALASVASIIMVYAAWHLSNKVIETYIAFLVMAMGAIALKTRKSRWRETYRQNRLIGFAILGGINKGIGSSGYGPLITLGCIYAGIREKSAVALTTLAEGVVSLFGCFTFFILMRRGLEIDFSLLPSILTGSFLASVVAPYIVRFFPQQIYRYVIPSYAVLIGIFVLLKLYVF